MIEENNDIYLGGNDAVMYLAKPVHKKCSTTFVWGHPFNTFISYDQFFNPLPLYAPVKILDDLPPSCIPPVAYALNGWPISQPKNK